MDSNVVKMLVDVVAHEWRQGKVDGRLLRGSGLQEVVCLEVR